MKHAIRSNGNNQQVRDIPNGAVVCINGKIGRLEKYSHPDMYVVFGNEPAIKVTDFTEVDQLHHPASIIDAYIANKYR